MPNEMTEIKLKGSPKAVDKLAKKIVKICKIAKCECRKGRTERLVETNIFVKLNVYAVQELIKTDSKNVKVEVI